MEASSDKRQTWWICLGLTLAVLAAYSPLRQCKFVTYDDVDYINRNVVAQNGLTWPGIVWAFSTGYASNWHPLTWISHMLDFQLYGMNPAGHHLSSLLLHAANSVLLFLLLRRMTQAQWPSALAAAFFGLHPMHVESVAWVSERKDVLSTLFWILTTWAYVRYVEEIRSQRRQAKRYYLGAIVLFALGLMAKPMLVTLPFILVLLDYWPLGRCQKLRWGLLVEKIPFFILSAVSSVITYVIQQRSGAVSSLGIVPLSARLKSISVAYTTYLFKTLWPARLAVLYPFSSTWAIWEIAGCAALLAGITAWVIWRRRAQPYLIVGWLWFMGMLAPVIGLVHIGSEFIADRYDYLPSVGLFIMILWTARDWTSRMGARLPAMMAGLALAACFVVTPGQVRYWRDSETLYRHALAITSNNGIMENDLANLYCKQGRLDEALPHALRAVALTPWLAASHYNLATIYQAKGEIADALSQFEINASLAPNDFIVQYAFGKLLLDNGLAKDALPPLARAVQLLPRAVDARCKLADACRQAGRSAEAESQYEQALQLDPQCLPAASSLAWMLATEPAPVLRNGARAVQLALLAAQLSGQPQPRIAGILAAAYAEAGDLPKAVATAQQAIAVSSGDVSLQESLRSQLTAYRAGRPYRDIMAR